MIDLQLIHLHTKELRRIKRRRHRLKQKSSPTFNGSNNAANCCNTDVNNDSNHRCAYHTKRRRLNKGDDCGIFWIDDYRPDNYLSNCDDDDLFESPHDTTAIAAAVATPASPSPKNTTVPIPNKRFKLSLNRRRHRQNNRTIHTAVINERRQQPLYTSILKICEGYNSDDDSDKKEEMIEAEPSLTTVRSRLMTSSTTASVSITADDVSHIETQSIAESSPLSSSSAISKHRNITLSHCFNILHKTLSRTLPTTTKVSLPKSLQKSLIQMWTVSMGSGATMTAEQRHINSLLNSVRLIDLNFFGANYSATLHRERYRKNDGYSLQMCAREWYILLYSILRSDSASAAFTEHRSIDDYRYTDNTDVSGILKHVKAMVIGSWLHEILQIFDTVVRTEYSVELPIEIQYLIGNMVGYPLLCLSLDPTDAPTHSKSTSLSVMQWNAHRECYSIPTKNRCNRESKVIPNREIWYFNSQYCLTTAMKQTLAIHTTAADTDGNATADTDAANDSRLDMDWYFILFLSLGVTPPLTNHSFFNWYFHQRLNAAFRGNVAIQLNNIANATNANPNATTESIV